MESVPTHCLLYYSFPKLQKAFFEKKHLFNRFVAAIECNPSEKIKIHRSIIFHSAKASLPTDKLCLSNSTENAIFCVTLYPQKILYIPTQINFIAKQPSKTSTKILSKISRSTIWAILKLTLWSFQHFWIYFRSE